MNKHFGLSFNRSTLRVDYYKIPIDDLPNRLNGFRLAHLTDWHARWLFVRKESLIEALRRWKPHVVVSTGDFCDRRGDIPKAISYVEVIAAGWPMYAVLGNNDHDNFPAMTTRYLIRRLKEVKCRVLSNESVAVGFGQDRVRLVGIDDPLTNHADIDQAFLRTSKHVPTIVLAHSTEVIFGLHGERVDLLMTGHTHGGQISLPLIGPIRSADYYSRCGYWDGLHTIEGIRTYINRGIGCNALPIRINCPPTLAIIDLIKRPTE